MTRQLIEQTIRNFLNNVTDNDIYNEFSMQHELGIRLREEFKKYNAEKGCNFVVQFERNRRFFFSVNRNLFNHKFPRGHAPDTSQPPHDQLSFRES